jgi:hypothetical protein
MRDSASFALYSAMKSDMNGHGMTRGIFTIAVAFLCASRRGTKDTSRKADRTIDRCVLAPDEWSDGDSFRVRLLDGRLETFRLYFVETTESRVGGKRSDDPPFVPFSADLTDNIKTVIANR